MKRVVHVLGPALLGGGLFASDVGPHAWGHDCSPTNGASDCTQAVVGENRGVITEEVFERMLSASSLLEAFEIAEANVPPGVVSYGTVASIGENGIELTELVLVIDGEAISVNRVVVNGSDWRSMLAGTPAWTDTILEGLDYPVSMMNLPTAFQPLLGDAVRADLAVNRTIDDGLLHQELALRMADLATIDFVMSARAVDHESDDFDPLMLFWPVVINDAELVFQDAGLFAMILQAAGSSTGMAPEQTIQMAAAQLQLMSGQSTNSTTQASIRALTAFLEAGTTPEGMLTISVNPATPFSPFELAAAEDLDSVVEIMGLSIDYQ